MEDLLHYVWKHKIFPLKELVTTAGQRVEVIDAGLHNTDAGPDFFNAKLKIDDTLWVGNVEVHTHASHWTLHGHHTDEAYNNVVLHVVEVADAEVCRPGGDVVPQLVLAVPPEVRQHYEELCRADTYPPCYEVIATLPRMKINAWLTALQAERLEQRAAQIEERLKRNDHHWEDVFFITLARNFGFGLNGDAFEQWAMRLPFRAVDKHRDNLFQVEALFFGTAGMPEHETPEVDAADYYLRLQREYRYLRHKFGLAEPMPASQWKFLRLRPDNFPHVRLAQLAMLYHSSRALFSKVMEAGEVNDVFALLAVGTSDFWKEHYCFNRPSPRRAKVVGRSALNLFLINTVIPFLYAYGRHKDDDGLRRRASVFLDSLKAEDNHIIRLWQRAGIHADSAAHSQALIQLQREYCEKRDCLRCRFGYEFLKRR